MPVNTKEMSRVTGIPEGRIKASLGIRTHITRFAEAYTAYKRVVAKNSQSEMEREVEFELLCKYTTTFIRALWGYRLAPCNTSERIILLQLANSFISSGEEARMLLSVTPACSAEEAYVLRSIRDHFITI